MKTFYLLLFLVASTLTVYSQPYLSTGITAKGITGRIGILSDVVDISVGMKMPILNREALTIRDFSLGKRILLSHEESDNYSITPSIGYAEVKYESFDYKGDATRNLSTHSIYAIELAKDSYCGRFYLKGTYCTKPYLEFGLKFFITQPN